MNCTCTFCNHFSCTAEEGISLFAFHGKLNEEFDGLEAGSWARDITKVKNGRYTFRDRMTQLKVNEDMILKATCECLYNINYLNIIAHRSVTLFTFGHM